jgi:demethylmenaquinone methyltransferase/2-methoxy-6-polyprenyl-1,4-benzoquinol methylase
MNRSEDVQALFDGVAPWYDTMNRRMSLGLDRWWRRRALRGLPEAGRRVLDVATGTADLALAAARLGVERVVGIDFSAGMLALARSKVDRAGLEEQVLLLQGDALALPFPAESFDAVLNAFLLRNLPALEPAFAEMGRVVRPGGRLICLEIAYPGFPPWRALFRLYFDCFVPRLGRWLTRVAPAYRYLPQSLARFPPPRDVLAALAAAGWREGQARSLFPGTVRLYTAVR